MEINLQELENNYNLFSRMGAMRGNNEIKTLFEQAYIENREFALRNLVHLRNIRLGGLGERDATLYMIEKLFELNENDVITVAKNLSYFGRWSDVIEVFNMSVKLNNPNVSEQVIEVIREEYFRDVEKLANEQEVSLLGKWLPTINTRNSETRALAKRLSKELGISQKEYRQTVSQLRTRINILEKNLVNRTYSNIDVAKLPTLARFKESSALNNYLFEEMSDYYDDIKSGVISMKTTGLTPYDIINNYFNNNEIVEEYELSWKNLEDTVGGSDENVIVVADTSASMLHNGNGVKNSVIPYKVAMSIALYTAERLKGAFKDNFIMFSYDPRLVNINSDLTLKEKMKQYTKDSEHPLNTDIQKVYDLILYTAVSNDMSQEELPSKIVIVSDMKFDEATKPYSNYEEARQKFASFGYDLPSIIFWNVNSNDKSNEISFDTNNVAKVSGLSPNVFKGVLGAEVISPVQTMYDVLSKKEYDFIVR